jgi:hypothetical protein
VLHLGGVVHDADAIRNDADLEAFVLTAIDLHHLKHTDVRIGGAAPTAGQRTTLRQGLLAIANIISARIRARPGNTVTVAELNALRDAIDNRPLRESAITGGTMTIPPRDVHRSRGANPAMQAAFRARLDHLRGLMAPANASHVDIRG